MTPRGVKPIARFVPLSVRHSKPWSRRRLRWHLAGLRERVALIVAPWLTPHPDLPRTAAASTGAKARTAGAVRPPTTPAADRKGRP